MAWDHSHSTLLAHGAGADADARPAVSPSVLAVAVSELTAIVGPDNLSVDESETAEYGADKFSFHTGPGCVCVASPPLLADVDPQASVHAYSVFRKPSITVVAVGW